MKNIKFYFIISVKRNRENNRETHQRSRIITFWFTNKLQHPL